MSDYHDFAVFTCAAHLLSSYRSRLDAAGRMPLEWRRRRGGLAMDVRRVVAWMQGCKQSLVDLARRWPRQSLIIGLLVIVVLTGVLGQGPFGGPTAGNAQTRPNRFDPTRNATSVTPSAKQAHLPDHWTPPPAQPIRRGVSLTMHDGRINLDPAKPTQFVGSDGLLELDAPAGTVSQKDLAAAGGALTLQITQIAPASGSTAGGSGHISLGQYLVQLVDAHGKRPAQGLRQPVGLKFHCAKLCDGVDPTRVSVVVNGSAPRGLPLAPLATASRSSGLGARATMPVTFDRATRTLTAQAALSGTGSTISWDTYAAVATFGKPDPFSANLSADRKSGV